MIKKKLIHFNTYSAFLESKSLLYDWTIAFIKETKQIYTHQTFYDCDIEDINELNDKIDEILADIYVDVEVDATNGVYIQATDGLLYTEADWDGTKTPNGIAVITDNCRFVMALQNAHSSSCKFGGYGTEVSGITTTTSSSTAATDYDGNGNTTTIINALNGTNDGYVDGAPAAEYCRAYTFPNGVTGYMGAAGEWQAALNNKSAVASALSACGGTAMSNWYWTSTQCNSDRSWYMNWDNENLYYDTKYNPNSVRAFAALSTKQSLKDKLDELEQSIPTKVSQLENDANYGTVTSITAGNGLTGGTITGSGTIALEESGVTAKKYPSNTAKWNTDMFVDGSAYNVQRIVNMTGSITVDKYGRITNATFYNNGVNIYYPKPATTSLNGLMTASDKTKLDGIDMSTKQDKIELVNHGTSDTTFTLTPNVYHTWGTVTLLNLQIDREDNIDGYNEYMFEFSSGDTPTTLMLPSAVSWVMEPVIEANKTYQVSILNYVGIIVGV